ncbi:hypothetical protein [Cellulomonas septica]|uniref:Uncharacterized protein n=1 Tax=Cellulomonas septica TaxID=285080 RepID=A0ABX1JXL0_9CELL|nr:hypothetical protein [Cellulomonas septica]NKY38082.1 hypothetical protein [Cellulomonas septica]
MSSVVGSIASLAARGVGGVVRLVRSAFDRSTRRPSGTGGGSGWLVVTVYRDASDVDVEVLPAPLAELDGTVEVRVRPAAGGKGTELAARQRGRQSSTSGLSRLAGSDPQADLRSALRRTKQLIEVGEVLTVDPVPHGKRKATPGGALLEAWTKVAPKAGVR